MSVVVEATGALAPAAEPNLKLQLVSIWRSRQNGADFDAEGAGRNR